MEKQVFEPGASKQTKDSEVSNSDDDSDFTVSLRPTGTTAAKYTLGDEIEFTLSVSKDAYVYCYMQQYNGDIYQIFPTPFHGSNRLYANQIIDLPGDSRLKITADSPGPREEIQCVGHEPDKMKNLSQSLQNRTFERLSYPSLNKIIEQHRSGNSEYSQSNPFILHLN